MEEEGRENIYEEMGCFDPNTPAKVTVESSFLQTEPPPTQTLVAGSTSNSNCSVDVEELSEFHLSPQDCPQFHVNPPPPSLPPPPPCGQILNNSIDLIHQNHSNGDNVYQDFVNLGPNSETTPDLLNLLHLPRYSLPPPHHPSSMLPNSSISFSDIMSSSAAAVMYDPLFHLNFPLQPRDHQNQQRNGSSLLGVEDQISMDANGAVNMMYFEGVTNNNNHGGFNNGILDFNTGVTRKARGSRKSRTFPTERERRVHFTDRFDDLKSLIPNPKKSDRASIVGEAIDHIKELVSSIKDLKMLVEKKRFGKFRTKKKARTDGGGGGGDQDEEEEDTVSYRPQSEVDQSCFKKNNYNSLRCSWLKRKSKVTEVDVRIIDDEVTIKLVQKKKVNSLLFTTKVLNKLQLDLHHVAGGQIGEHYSFLFNTKICEGACVYASRIADTLMEVVEKQYMQVVPNNQLLVSRGTCGINCFFFIIKTLITFTL